MSTIRAIFENGVFRPLDPVDLPDGTLVEFEPRVITEPTFRGAESDAADQRIWEILSQEFDSEPDTAARHNEHQP